jgi:hypothetical protein
MSIELKQAAQQAIDALNEAVAFREGGRQKAIDAVTTLRTAIQQAESGACKSFTELRERHREGVDAELAAMAAKIKTDEPVVEPSARVELMKTGGNAGLSTRIIELDIATRERLRPGDLLYTHPAPGVPDDVVKDAERGRFLVGWLKRFGLLQTEYGQMGAGEKPESWWLLHAPWGIDKTRPFFGHGKTPEQAIDAAMTAAQAQKEQP